MSSLVKVAVIALTLPLLTSLVAAQSKDSKPTPVKPLPPPSKPAYPEAKPAPPKPAAPVNDEDAAKRRERMQQRDREIDRMLKDKGKK
jgi:hypothetical protein